MTKADPRKGNRNHKWLPRKYGARCRACGLKRIGKRKVAVFVHKDDTETRNRPDCG